MAVETVQIHGLRETLEALDKLRQEISARGVAVKPTNPLRSALRQAANVIMKQARANVDAIVAIPNNGPNLSTGLLRKSIKVRRPNRRYWRSQHDELARVYIDTKARYPVELAGKRNRVSDVGFMLEFGTERRAPMPFMRPAFEAKKAEAVQKFKEDFERRVNLLIARYSATGA